MSNPPFQQKPEGQRTNHLQSEQIPFAFAAPHHVAHYAAATGGNYFPRPQMPPTAYTTGAGFTVPNITTPATTASKPMSDFAASAYATAEQGGNGLQPPPAQPIDLNTFKALKFVTLDGLQIETREVYDDISGTWQWEACESQEDRCLEIIRDKCTDKRVFLICSGSLGRKTVPLIHELPQVYAIYIYCADVEGNLKWTKQYSKIRVVCNDDDKYLVPQFAVDVAQANIEWGDALVKQGKRDKAKEKYQKALDNLNKHAKHPDPIMTNKVKGKLDECK